MSHQCPWPGCKEKVAANMWGCRHHWYRLPNNLRSWIGRAYRIGIQNGTHPTDSWRNAHTAALDWIATRYQHDVQVQQEREP
jgi:hypothetical protein